jgi:hypothetical protein
MQAAAYSDSRSLKTFGIPHIEAVALNDGLPLGQRGGKVSRYQMQKKAAKKRGIGWEITLAEWVALWNDSGKWALRGVRKGCYCMARNGDVGPYKVGNVAIVLCAVNHRERPAAKIGRVVGTDVKGWSKVCKNRLKPYQAKLGRTLLGHFATPEEASAAYFSALGQAA